MKLIKNLIAKLKRPTVVASSAGLGDAPAKKPYGLEDAIADYKKQEAEMQERLEWIKTSTDDELTELMALADFSPNSSFNDKRFTQKVMLESMRRILVKLKSPNEKS
jgi:hypothetical protein